MGQSQSSDSPTGTTAQDVKTSYYVLLGIDRSATEDEIKKAYRRKALELHPDRNYGNEEAATRTFAEIQAAYEVLSDPQERAWYDSHETAILRGDDAVGGDGDVPTYENVRMTSADELARMVRKFNSNVEFTDAPAGFFGFVRETFEQLAKEEEAAANWEDVDVEEYPSFGHKDDGYGDVVKSFYAAWGGFSTVKSFSWRDKYRLSEAPDRWYRRKMEQENEKLRKEGRQEFNDAVRSLVAFIRKRDPRFVPNTQTEAERQKTLRDAAAAQAARARAANAAKINVDDVPEWTKVREPDELEESEEEEIEEEVFECVACNKIFKSERQWEAHEKSKKHQKAIKDLQRRMRKQNAALDLEESVISSGIATPEPAEDGEEDEVLEDLAAEVEEHHAQPNGHSQNTEKDEPQENIDDYSEASDKDDVPHDQASQHDQEEKTSDVSEEVSNSENEDYASMETIQARMQSAALEPSTADASNDDSAQAVKPKMGKAAQKRAKKAAAAASGQSEASHTCQVCNAEFASRSKLFQHIEDEGHAALKSGGSGGGAKGKKGKGKR